MGDKFEYLIVRNNSLTTNNMNLTINFFQRLSIFFFYNKVAGKG